MNGIICLKCYEVELILKSFWIYVVYLDIHSNLV